MAKTSAKHNEKYISGEDYQALRQTSSQPDRQVTIQTRWIGWAAATIVLLVVGFWSGMAYQKGHSKTAVATTGSTAGGGLSGRGFGGGARRSGGFGQVTAVSPTSITITSQRTNTSTTYTITSSTTITDNGQTVTTTDIQTGDTVIVMTSGTGSTTATSILVNPSFGGGGGGFGGTSAPTGSDDSTPSQTN
jgi:hypothetical protein